MTNQLLSLILLVTLNCMLFVQRSSSQELTARFDYGLSDVLNHSQTSVDYYLNRKYGFNLGLDIGTGSIVSYYYTGYPFYNSYTQTRDLRYAQLKIGGVRRFFVGKSFIEPIVGVAYCFGPRNLYLDGEKVTNSGVLITNGIELQFATEYNITKKWAVRFQYSINNTDYLSSLGLRYSFFYDEK